MLFLIEDNKENLADNKIQTHLVDFFSQKISILKIFAPEHGFAGQLTPENISTEWILQPDYRLFRFMVQVKSIKGN
jgi:hypothetical protein